MKVRVHELAKKYKKDNKEVVDALAEAGLKYKSHLAAIDPKDVDRAISFLDEKYIVKEEVKKPKGAILRKASLRKKPSANVENSEGKAEENNVKVEKEQSKAESSKENGSVKPVSKKERSDSDSSSSESLPPKGVKEREKKGEESKYKVKPAAANSNSKENNNSQDSGGSKEKFGRKKAKDREKTKDKEKGSSKFKMKAMESREYTASQFASRRSKRKQKRIAVQKKVEDFRKSLKEERIITCGDDVTVKMLADKIGIGPAEIVKHLFMKGYTFSINSLMPFDLIEEIALKYNVLLEKEEKVTKYTTLDFNLKDADPDKLKERAPIVTVMGHVDHGKTSLLDSIRATKVVQSEAGGITQKIGAYQVEVKNKKITFIDTPGHEAFTEMRARGTSITDLIILVVAADDGVKPQTIEAISHAKAAKVPIIVAVNKIDKSGIDVARVKQELAEHGIMSHDWGGENEFVEVSALNGTNIEHLLEIVLLTSEVLELKAVNETMAKAVVLESRLNAKVGAIADIIVKEGTLKRGDVFVINDQMGKVRSMVNDEGKKIDKALPSYPVEITGLSAVPQVGEILEVVDGEKTAKKLIGQVEKKKAESVIYSNVHAHEDANMKNFNIILKAASKGALEAIKNAVLKIESEEVKLSIVHSSVGAVSEGDIKLASASNASIMTFNTTVAPNAKAELAQKGVSVKSYSVIYKLVEEIEETLQKMLTPKIKELYIGSMKVLKIFNIPKVGTIAGGVITEGKINKDSIIAILRDSVEIYKGKISSLKKYAEYVKTVNLGQECGVTIDGYSDFKEDDIIKVFQEIEG